MIICPSCGRELPDNARFCENCGSNVVSGPGWLDRHIYFKHGARKVVTVVAVLILLFVILCIAVVIFVPGPDADIIKHIKDYVDIKNLTRMEGGGDPYRIGQLVVVDKSSKKLDDIFSNLPGEVCAGSSTEVGTVVWLEWRQSVVGKYHVYSDSENGKARESKDEAALQWFCKVTLIDFKKSAIIYETEIKGEEPPYFLTQGEINPALEKPTKKVLKLLVSLPERRSE